MFSLNPAFDQLRGGAIPWEKGAMDNLQGGIDPVRVEFYDYCATHHIGVTVMKTFGGGGKLLDEKTSPLGVAYTPEQCIAYCLAKKDCKRIKQILMEYNATKRGKGIVFA